MLCLKLQWCERCVCHDGSGTGWKASTLCVPRDRGTWRTQVQTQGMRVCWNGKRASQLWVWHKGPFVLRWDWVAEYIKPLFGCCHLRHGWVYNISSLVGVLIGQATSDKGTGARKDSGHAYKGTVCCTATARGSGNYRKCLSTLPIWFCLGVAWKGEAYEGEGGLGKSSQIFVDNLDLTVLGYSPILVCQCKRLWKETQCGRVPNE